MYVANPTTEIIPNKIQCNGKATMNIKFRAASELYVNAAEIILMLDCSEGITNEELDKIKLASNTFITNLAKASIGIGESMITNGSRLGIMSFADKAIKDIGLTHDIAELKAAINKLEVKQTKANYKTAFETANLMLPKQGKIRSVVVLFSHSADIKEIESDPIVEEMKKKNVDIYCIGLNTDINKLNKWASSPIKDHVENVNNINDLDKAFYEITAEIVLSGVLDGKIVEKLNPDFKINRIISKTDGIAEILDNQTLNWNISSAATNQQPVWVELSFEIEHIGKTEGIKDVNNLITYEDRAKNKLEFPNAKIEVTCKEETVIVEECPEPIEIDIDGCKDNENIQLTDIHLESLGRILELNTVIKNVCYNKSVAVAVILTELIDGIEENRGIKYFTIPVADGIGCRDVKIECIRFILPEQKESICGKRDFRARVMANYIDTDFKCCN